MSTTLTNDDVLEIERENRSRRNSPEAKRWKRAQWAFEFYASRTVTTSCPRSWASLPGTERAVWHDMMALLEQDR